MGADGSAYLQTALDGKTLGGQPSFKDVAVGVAVSVDGIELIDIQSRVPNVLTDSLNTGTTATGRRAGRRQSSSGYCPPGTSPIGRMQPMPCCS